MSDTVHPLQGSQMDAVRPDDTVWLSASAGTGKTHVLSSRVLRLLLTPGVEPSQILCLTFTKAGAAEMAERVNSTLAEWVRLDDTKLFKRLEAIGAPTGPEARARARTLFASVLDCPGGGLRIDTIHAFAQWLLGAFPEEAGLVPGTRAMEDRDRVLLLRQVLADLLVKAESDPLGDPQLLGALSDLSLRMGPEDVEAYLLRCAEAREAWFGPGSWQEPMRANVLRLLGLPANADESHVAALCADDAFDVAALRRCMAVNREWSAKTGQANADAIAAWLASIPTARADALADLRAVFIKKDGGLRASSSQDRLDPDYPECVAAAVIAIDAALDVRKLLALADLLVPALRLGRAFALAWDEAKKREGLIDFDDQIRQAAGLLNRKAVSDWIRYKLDRRFDHILVDEAQDTNKAQWDIIFAMAEEFWAGLGQRGALMRTLFVVGDYKQAIFRFQGTSPENFRRAGNRVRQAMAGAAKNARDLRSNVRPRSLQELGLEQSFRTASSVLAFVDRAIAGIGHTNFGLDKPPEPHKGQDRAGYVSLWRPVGGQLGDEADAGDDADEGPEGWLDKPERQLADRIAQQVKTWIDGGFALRKGGKRRATAGDVMVLVRKRGDLAALIVARLHAAGVPVAGVDRLRLGAPLAVKDLVAALRFAAQPFDDLNLAALLVSPLIGWSQEQLLEHGYRDKGVPLWIWLRRSRHGDIEAARLRLDALLRRADFEPPQALLHWLLAGPWQGRQKLVARLGHEANDPIDELVNAAHAYATSATPSLVGFINWFDAGEGELKREAGNAGDQVRVMTVHGAKGLQSPIVILADATADPSRGRGITLDLPDPADPDRMIPLPSLSKDQRVGPVAEHHAECEAAELEEHWRLLYVAMTRAEEALFVGGALKSREKEPAPNSWYARLRALYGADEWLSDPLWGGRLDDGTPPEMLAEKPEAPELALPEPLPRWLTGPPPDEPRPPKPLAPSALGEDMSADPPNPPGTRIEAARRGVLIHKLLERLPEVPAEARAGQGARWLERNAPEQSPETRERILADSLAVLDDPRFSSLFAPGSLAEVPLAATIGSRVVAGTVDRLLVTSERIQIVDYKTARRPPERIEDVAPSVLRQMAAYAAALEAVYPGRSVEVALLFTAGPHLIAIPPDVLTRHKQALSGAE